MGPVFGKTARSIPRCVTARARKPGRKGPPPPAEVAKSQPKTRAPTTLDTPHRPKNHAEICVYFACQSDNERATRTYVTPREARTCEGRDAGALQAIKPKCFMYLTHAFTSPWTRAFRPGSSIVAQRRRPAMSLRVEPPRGCPPPRSMGAGGRDRRPHPRSSAQSKLLVIDVGSSFRGFGCWERRRKASVRSVSLARSFDRGFVSAVAYGRRAMGLACRFSEAIHHR